LHFATLDIRQDSSVHTRVITEICTLLGNGDYTAMDDAKKIEWLSSLSDAVTLDESVTPITKDTIDSVKAVKHIQEQNGKPGSDRYIISQCNSAVDILEVFALFVFGG
jgi:phosphoenolpyruvate carboxylase